MSLLYYLAKLKSIIIQIIVMFLLLINLIGIYNCLLKVLSSNASI